MDFASFSSGAPAPAAGGTAPVIRTAPEPVRAQFFPNQIVQLFIPHNTSRSRPIRLFNASFCLNGRNERVFIFRQAQGAVVANWTTVALESRPDAPRLTMGPIAVAEMLVNMMAQQCPDVSTVTLYDQHNAVITIEQIRAYPFLALPDGAIGPPPAALPLPPPIAAGWGCPAGCPAGVSQVPMEPPSQGIASMGAMPMAVDSSAISGTAADAATGLVASEETVMALPAPPTPWEQDKHTLVAAMQKIEAESKTTQQAMEKRMGDFQSAISETLGMIMEKLDGVSKDKKSEVSGASAGTPTGVAEGGPLTGVVASPSTEVSAPARSGSKRSRKTKVTPSDPPTTSTGSRSAPKRKASE